MILPIGCLLITLTFVVFVMMMTRCDNEKFSHNKAVVYYPGKFVLYYADWCPHCHDLMPVWDELKSKKLVITDKLESKTIPSHLGIKSFPTIRYYKGEQYIDYRGARDISSFIKFLESQK